MPRIFDNIEQDLLPAMKEALSVSERADLTYHSILVPLDGSGVAECSLPHAKAIAKAFQVHKVFLTRVLMPFRSRVFEPDAY